MCGILGLISINKLNNDLENKFQNSLSFLKYRGPDFLGYKKIELNDQYGLLGHTRLGIIDLDSNANQPLNSSSGKSIIVFNGEIYNYKTIREELIKNGAHFKTRSDTEVILNAYEYWGIEELLNKLDGMFSFGLYDIENKKLFLARDRFGKKPLYYYHSNETFIFSSDIRSIKNLMPQKPKLDMYSFGYYLAELSTPEADTIWKEIKKIKPGHYAKISLEGSSFKATHEIYWKLQFSSNCELPYNEIVEKSESLFNYAVRKRLVGDVRVSALLSGGLDSSLVVAKMAEESSGRINTYSVTSSNKAYDESFYSDLVAKKFNTDHTKITIEPESLKDINKLIQEYGEPFADSSMIPSYLICKEVSKTEKVVLGGDGGDELFGGYDSYYKAYKIDKVKGLKWSRKLANLVSNYFPSYRTNLLAELLEKANQPKHSLLNRGFSFSKLEIQELTNSGEAENAQQAEHIRIIRDLNSSKVPTLNLVMNASLKTRLLNDYLVKVDRASMYASLEMRSPFLDKDLALFAGTLKPKQLFMQGEPKAILKSLAKKYFNDEFIYRKKMGFSIPVGEWFRNELNLELKEKLLEPNKLINLNIKFIEQLILEHEKGIANHTHKLWALFVFNIWSKFQ